MKISELREILHEIQYIEGDLDIYAMVTRDSGYLIDCHNEVHKNPLIKTGEDYTIVLKNACETEMSLQELDGFAV